MLEKTTGDDIEFEQSGAHSVVRSLSVVLVLKENLIPALFFLLLATLLLLFLCFLSEFTFPNETVFTL